MASNRRQFKTEKLFIAITDLRIRSIYSEVNRNSLCKSWNYKILLTFIWSFCGEIWKNVEPTVKLQLFQSLSFFSFKIFPLVWVTRSIIVVSLHIWLWNNSFKPPSEWSWGYRILNIIFSLSSKHQLIRIDRN